jgi:hypothetical protein
MVNNMSKKDIQNTNTEIKQSIVKRSGRAIGVSAHKVVVRPAQKRYEKLYRQRSMNLVSDFLIIIGIMVLFTALIFFWNHPITSNRYIDLQMSTNSEHISGAEVSYTIHWENNNRNAVQKSYLSLIPPNGFVIIDVKGNGFEYNESSHLIVMNDLLPGANGEIEIAGYMWANVHKEVEWETRLYYKNLGINHNKTLKSNFIYDKSLLNGEIVVPNQVYINNSFPININIYNNSDKNIPLAIVNLQFPPDFEFIQKSFDIQDNEWKVGSLAPGQSKIVSIQGRLTYLAAAQAQFGVAVNLIQDSEYLRQDWQSDAAEFVLPKIDLDMNILSSDEFNTGKQYKAQLYYYNYEDFLLNDVVIKFYSQANGLVSEFSPSKYYYNEIGAGVENFLSPSFSINKSNGLVDGKVVVWAELSWVDIQNDEAIRRYVFSGKRQINITPHLNSVVNLYYFTPGGDQVGYGPLPPVVGESTSYWISIRLWPSFGEIKDIELQVLLGDGVKLLDYNTSLGSVSSGDGVTWMIGDYNSAWNYQPQPRLNLHVEISPNFEQLNKSVVLLDSIKAKATNLATDRDIMVELGQMDNDMSDVNIWTNDGRVVAW